MVGLHVEGGKDSARMCSRVAQCYGPLVLGSKGLCAELYKVGLRAACLWKEGGMH